MASNTLQDWQNYINDYEQKLASKKQELDSKLNNSSLSDAEKKQALEDYTKQESYLQWLKTKRDEYAATGEIPSDMSFNITANGDLYRYNGEIHVATLPSLTSYTGDTQDTLYTLDIGTTLTTESLDICSSPDCIINLTWGGNHTFAQYTHESLKLVATYAPNAHTIILGVVVNYSEDPWDKTAYMAASGSGTWVNASGYTPSDPATSLGGIDSGYVKFGIGYNYEIANTLNDIPTWQDSFYGMFSGPNIWQSFSPANELFARRYCSVSYSGDLSDTTPWDFYNDEILPNIDPDNAAFPNGYEPIGPGGDPDDGPEEEIAPDKQDWGDEPEPHNGFEIPYAFANYAAFNAAGIRNFAERLWDAPDSFWDALTITNKNNANWLDYFVSLRAYPYVVNSTGIQSNIYVGAGGKFYLGDSGEDVYASVPQHLSYYALSLSVPKYYNNFLDFAPYTKAYIYLPFSGTWEINPKFLYHTHVMIMLTLDITDGSGVWQVYRYADPQNPAEGQAGNHYIILEKQCKIGVEIPLSGLNATTMASNIVNASLASQQRLLSTTTQLLGDAASGNVGKFMTDIAQVPIQALTDSANLANANREIPTASGGMSGLAAANACVIPFITLIRPVVENPESFPHTVGNLVNKASKLEKLSGFTTCRNVDVSNVPQATDKEKAQLKRILEGGFYSVSG